MVKEIIKYPNAPEVRYTEDIRAFNEELFALIEDMKDTMNENNLEGLSAFQIGSIYSVVVVKDENGEFLELINPRIIRHDGTQENIESSAYYDGLEAKVKRFDMVSVVYQDREGKQHSMEVRGKLSALIQRKVDFNYGATLILKLSKEERERFENELEKKFGTKESSFKLDSLMPGIFKRK